MELNQHLYQKWIAGIPPGDKRNEEIAKIVFYRKFNVREEVEKAFASAGTARQSKVVASKADKEKEIVP